MNKFLSFHQIACGLSLLLVGLLYLVSGCVNPPDFADVPKIELIGLSKDSLLQGVFQEDSVVVVFSFEDGDGDIGRTEQSPANNVFFTDTRSGLVDNTLARCEEQGLAVNLFGVSHALLDFAERYPQPLRNTRIFETGGMKGRRAEIPKADLHRVLCEAFALDGICSEYGMTELLSQAWSHGQGIYQPNATLRIMIRDVRDPLSYAPDERRGGVNCIDLANIDTCAFIATDDLGVRYSDRSFSILGRLDNSDLRGCNLMLADYY